MRCDRGSLLPEPVAAEPEESNKPNLSNKSKDMEITLNRHLEGTPEVRAGKPRIAGSRITVADIVIMHLRMGQSLDLISGKYNLPLAAVYAAMAYYYDHKTEIDQQIQEDEAFADTLMQLYPSRLQEKLRALQNEQ